MSALGRLFSLAPLANHFPALHGVRVLAIVLVVQFHVTGAFVDEKLAMSPLLATLSWSMFFGMDLFFLLSGFLIGTMILHASETGEGTGILRFWLRRAFRIFPLYYVSLAVLVALYPMNATQRANLPFELVYLTNYLHVERSTTTMMWGWSLCVEEHFYLVVPFLMAGLSFVRSRGGKLVLLALLFSTALVVRLAILFRTPLPWNETAFFQDVYIRTHTRYDTLVAGVFLAFVQRQHLETVRAWVAKAWVRWLVALHVVLCLAFLMIQPPQLPLRMISRCFAWGTVTSLMYVPLLLVVMNHDGWAPRLLSRGGFLKVATLGYGIYLWHVPVLEKVVLPLTRRLADVGAGPSAVWWSTLALLLVATTGAAWVTHLAVEKPALWLRDRLAR